MDPILALLNAAELAADELPEWLLLVPGGRTFRGVDGRRFRSPGAAAVIAAHRNRQDIPIDLNHSEIRRAPFGGESPAVGWIRELQERNGEVWGRAEWNDAGAAAIRSRAYRFHSPVYIPNRRTDIEYIHSVGLVNSPNLPVAPLSNREEQMNFEKIAQALGLPAAASEAQILAAIAQTNSQSKPEAVEMVTKADYELMANRAATAEQKLADRDAADLRRQAEALVDAAIKDAKVAPASRGFYLNRATSAEEIEQLKSFLATAPKVVAGETAAAGAQPNEAGADRRTPEQIEVDRQLGVDGSAEPQDGAPA